MKFLKALILTFFTVGLFGQYSLESTDCTMAYKNGTDTIHVYDLTDISRGQSSSTSFYWIDAVGWTGTGEINEFAQFATVQDFLDYIDAANAACLASLSGGGLWEEGGSSASIKPISADTTFFALDSSYITDNVLFLDEDGDGSNGLKITGGNLSFFSIGTNIMSLNAANVKVYPSLTLGEHIKGDWDEDTNIRIGAGTIDKNIVFQNRALDTIAKLTEAGTFAHYGLRGEPSISMDSTTMTFHHRSVQEQNTTFTQDPSDNFAINFGGGSGKAFTIQASGSPVLRVNSVSAPNGLDIFSPSTFRDVMYQNSATSVLTAYSSYDTKIKHRASRNISFLNGSDTEFATFDNDGEGIYFDVFNRTNQFRINQSTTNPTLGARMDFQSSWAENAINAADYSIGVLEFSGQYDASNFADVAQIRVHTAEAYSSGNTGSYMNFWTTPIGSSTMAEAMRIENDGDVVLPSAASRLTAHTLKANFAIYADFINNSASSKTMMSWNQGGLYTNLYGLVIDKSGTADDGSVGINTVNPDSGYKLHVNGKTKSDSLVITNPTAIDSIQLLMVSTVGAKLDLANDGTVTAGNSLGIQAAHIGLNGNVWNGTTSVRMGWGYTTNASPTSAKLAVRSTDKGFLPPQQTTAQMSAISSPVNGLIVADTTESKVGFYDGDSWKYLVTESAATNVVHVTQESDFPAPIAGVITLDVTKLYLIEGDVSVTNKIDGNGATIMGLDRSFDKISSTLTTELFTGDGSVIAKNLTFTINGVGGKLFNLLGVTGFEYVYIQDCTFASNSDLGIVNNFYAVQVLNTPNQLSASGLTLTDIDNIDMRGFSTSQGHTSTTLLTINGTSGLIQLLGCGFGVGGGQTGLDVSALTVSNYGIIDGGSNFTGAGVHVNGSFSDVWEVEAKGIDTEKDDVAEADLYISASALTAVTAVNTPIKLAGTTTSVNNFRFDDDGGVSNRLRYIGTKTIKKDVHANLSMTSAANNKVFSYYIYHYDASAASGSVIAGSEIQRKQSTGSDIGALSVSWVVEFERNDYVEIWVENTTDDTDCTAVKMVTTIN